jgi:protocatechuate 3,4-dioxygenase, beta subunit
MSDRTRVTRRTLLAGAAALTAASIAAAVTPAQIEGPFFPARDQPDKDFDMTRIAGRDDVALGTVIEVAGRVLDADGQPIEGALIDIWQANAAGKYAHERDRRDAPLDPAFQGWAQLKTAADGAWRVRTIMPGAYPVSAGWVRPPHLHFKVARRGFHELITQMYFAGEPLNDVDRLLQAVPAEQRAALLVTFTEAEAGQPPHGIFDIRLAKV